MRKPPFTRDLSHRAATPLRNAAAPMTPQDQPAPADQRLDRRLSDELAENADGTVIARHRNGLTATEGESDGVSEDENTIDEEVIEEADEHSRDKRRPASQGRQQAPSPEA